MTYTAPTTEQLFVLDHIARIDAMAQHERFAAATPDMVEAIVTGIGDFAAEVYAPLNRVGDTQNPKWQDGKVTMPPGFKQAYKQFVEAGWGKWAGGVLAAWYQYDVAAHLFSCSQTFADRFMVGLGLDAHEPWLFGIFASCMDAQVKVLGVAYALWSLGLFCVLGLMSLAALLRRA